MERQKEKKKNSYLVTIPRHRLDIESQEDLLEEMAKIYSYNKVLSSLPIFKRIRIEKESEKDWEKLIRECLINSGYQEIITYSLVDEDMKKHFSSSKKKEKCYRLLFPKSNNHRYYRQNILPSHWKIIHYNLSHKNNDLLFFELSDVYAKTLDQETIFQEKILALSGTGKFIANQIHGIEQGLDFFWIKGTVEKIFQKLNIVEKVNFVPSQTKILHPYQSSDIILAKKKIGFIGKIHSQVRQSYQINQEIFVGEISLSKVYSFLLNSDNQDYKMISVLPKIERDLSFILNDDVHADKVIKIIKKIGGKFLISVKIFDIYQKENYAKSQKKSLSFRLTFQSSKRNLLKEEINEKINEIVRVIQTSLDAIYRE